MKNSFTTIQATAKVVLPLLLCFLFIQNITAQGWGHNLSHPTGVIAWITYDNPPGVCQASGSDRYYGSQYYWSFIPRVPQVTEEYFSNDPAKHHLAVVGTETSITLDIPNVGSLPAQNSELVYKFGEAGGPDEDLLILNNPDYSARPGYFRYNLPVNFIKGTEKGYVSFVVRDLQSNFPTATWVVISFKVLGPTDNDAFANASDTIFVQPLDTIVEPQIPYLILHAPPGDGSSSSFQKDKTTCRSLETNYAEEGSHAANLKAKIGIAGEAGLFVTTKFEFSVTLSAGLEVGDMSYTASSNETCLTVSEGFSTSSMLNGEGGGDVFVGYGIDLAVGIYEFFKLDTSTCSVVLDTGLVFAPVGELRHFAKTTFGIEEEIKLLQSIIADSANLDARILNNTQNQIDVWQQVLDMNQANVNNPNNEPIGIAFDMDGQANYFRDESIQVTETNTIQYEQYTNVNMGVTAKVEVAGSGFTGGYEFKGSKKFGKTTNQSTSESKVIKYTLYDDDRLDNFKTQIVRDPMYGTPIFRVNEAQSKSSCPYQVGYQIDQPKLIAADGSQDITLTDIPNGTTATFQLQVCNDSNYPRTYHLLGNSNTNLDGLIIEGFGNNLFNTNDNGVEFYLVPANSCLNLATLTVKQSNSNILDYEDIELYLNVDCQPGTAPILSSVFLNVHFTRATSVSDLENGKVSMQVTPNPNRGAFNVKLEGIDTEGMLTMTDVVGKRIFHQPVLATKNSLELNQEGLMPGIYFLIFQSDSQRVTQKLIIER